MNCEVCNKEEGDLYQGYGKKNLCSIECFREAGKDWKPQNSPISTRNYDR